MFKKSLLLTLLLALLVPWAANAQTVTVCNGTNNNQKVPFDGYNADSNQHNQMIFPATDLTAMNGNIITQMVFYIDTEANNSSGATYTAADRLGTWTVSLGETTATVLTGLDNTTVVSQVYQGYFDCSTGTLTLLFDDGYTYNGGNLLVDLNHAASGWARWYFLGVNQEENTAITSGSLYKFLPKTTFSYEAPAATPKPSGFAVSNILHNQADLSWTENGTATSWQICVNDDETNLITVTENPYTLTGLTPLTAYTVKVRSVGTPNSDWSTSKSFNTTAVAEAIGDSWSDDFEGVSCGWELINGTCEDAWVWGTATNNGGEHAIYVSNDGGTTNSYSHPSIKVFAAKLLTFTNGKFTFSYDWKAKGESSYDFLRVALVPASQTLTAGSDFSTIGTTSLPTGWIALDGGGKLNLEETWQNKEVTINVTAGNYYLVFAWRSDTSTSYPPSAAVDNVSITRVACPYDVTDLAVTASSITTTEATITWTAGDATEWQVAKKASGDTDWTILPNTYTAATATLTGLTAGTTYQVKARAYCNATDQGTWCDAISFTTECDVFNLTVKDFSENFNSYTVSTGFLPNCWTRINTGTNTTYNKYPYLVSGSGTSSSNCLRFYSYYSSSSTTTVTDQYAILPEMNGLSGKQIVLSAKGYNASSSFSIGLMSDPEDISTFQEIDTKALTTSYQEFLFDLPTTTANYVAIKMQAPTTSGTTYGVYIDDITIADPPQCAKPTSFAKANVTAHTVDLSWESDASAWVVAYKKTADENFTEVNVTTKTYQLTGLVGETEYVAKVKADCGSSIYSEYTNTVSFTTLVACAKPTTLTVSNISDTEATLGWTSEAGEFVVAYKADGDTDFTEITNVTKNAYIFDALTAGTVYTAKVKAVCGGEDGESQWSNTTTFTTSFCATSDMCSVGIELNDSYGDGWNGNKLQVVDVLTNVVLGTYTLSSGGSASYTLAVCDGRDINFVYVASGNYQYENGWVITDADDNIINEHVGGDSSDPATAGIIATHTVNCPSCIKPSNLQATAITTNSATMSWTGSSDSYVLQYRPWLPAGDDVQPTGNTMVEASYDLSGFTGTGSVVIRHYNCYNQFALIVDDIVVKNKSNETVFSEDFETCGGNMPSVFTNMDMDGDGHVWEIAASPTMRVNGSYGLASYSYDNNSSSVLYPDNWLIINNIPMGGSIAFNYCAQDADWAAENFCVYVSTESSIVEVPLTTTTYNATGLVANTPYAWQVKGICGDEQTNWASSFFQTLNDVIYFQTAGNWTDAANWDVNRVPTADDKVQIDAAAVIPANKIAFAKTITMGTSGSITIKEGGQLKQGTTNVDVTVEKSIAAVGDDNWDNAKSGYYLIATPVGTTLFASSSAGWGYAQNLISGDYDLYAFNPTLQGQEWYNYQANTSEFTKLYSRQGYLYASKSGAELRFIGTTPTKSHNNVVTEDFTYDATSTNEFNGWTLVGNPFTCNAYLTFTPEGGSTPQNIDFYVMNSTGSGFDLSATSVALNVCQGAFFYADANGTINFSSEVPSMSTGSNSGILNISLTQSQNRGGVVDQARIRFGQGLNLAKMSFNDNISKLYIPQDHKDYAVVRAEAQGEMPVNFKTAENGSYTISFTAEDVNFSYLHLIDNLTGNNVNLLETPSYSFDARTIDYASRFKLVFVTGQANMGDDFGFFDANGNLMILGIEGTATLQMIDVTGRIISSETFSGNYSKAINAKAGVYMLRLIQGNDVRTQKIVVK